MIQRVQLELYLADLLETAAFTDYCPNGVQIEGREEIGRIALGVSASRRLFEAAAGLNADAVVVHHGLFWKNSPHPLTLTGLLYQRVRVLIENGINLFAYHLPLDAHPEIGNNALMARALELDEISFTAIEGDVKPLAAVGTLRSPMPFDNFRAFADKALKTEGLALPLTGKPVERVFVLSGGGAPYYNDAVAAGADTLVTGELREDVVRSAEEAGLNLYAAGHYNSEKWGIEALGNHLRERFGLNAAFIDVPNPV